MGSLSVAYAQLTLVVRVSVVACACLTCRLNCFYTLDIRAVALFTRHVLLTSCAFPSKHSVGYYFPNTLLLCFTMTKLFLGGGGGGWVSVLVFNFSWNLVYSGKVSFGLL